MSHVTSNPNILIVGSFVMDQILSTRIFPQEGETVLGINFQKAPGGKGANQAVQIARLGANVTMVGKLGRDANGQELLAQCEAAGIDIGHVAYDESAASGCAVIILEETSAGGSQNRIIVVPGTNMLIQRGDVAFLEKSIRQYDMVILQLEIPMAINEYVAQLAYRNNVPVMLNPAPSAPLRDEFLSHLTYLSPNEHEAADLTGIAIRRTGADVEMDDVERAAQALLARGVKNVLITLGASGAVLCNNAGLFYQTGIKNVSAVDPTAAGDSFIGAFCFSVCRGWDWNCALRYANQAAAITVSRLGAIPSLPTFEEVTTALASGGCPAPGVQTQQ